MMTKRMFLKALAVCSTAALTGCVGTVDGGKRAGNPMVNDKISSLYEAPVTADNVFQAAKTVLGAMGNLYGENTINSTLQAKVDTRTVYIRVEEVNDGNVRLTTQVRKKNGGTDIPLASEVDKNIALELTSMMNQ